MLEKDLEMKDMEEEFMGLLRQSELKRKEVEKELKVREQTVAVALASSPSVRSRVIINNIKENTLITQHFF